MCLAFGLGFIDNGITMCCFCGFKGLVPAEGLSHPPAELHRVSQCVCVGAFTCVSDTRADLYMLPPDWINLFMLVQQQFINISVADFGCRYCCLISTTLCESQGRVSQEEPSISQNGHILSLTGKTPHF